MQSNLTGLIEGDAPTSGEGRDVDGFLEEQIGSVAGEEEEAADSALLDVTFLWYCVELLLPVPREDNSERSSSISVIPGKHIY